MDTLTQDHLKELLHYDSDTGIFTWRIRATKCSSVYPGSVAGYVNIRGYRVIRVNKKSYLAHRLAWFYVTGNWPANNIDHRDGQPSNNRLVNLRDVSQSVNMQNQKKALSNNKSGLLGVAQRRGKFEALIKANGKTVHLGVFPTKDLAHEAYLVAKRKYHEGCTI